MTLDPADLKLHIDEAFGGMAYPGDEHIAACDCSDCERVQSAFKGLHWRDVSFDTLDNLRTGLTFMSPEGFRFYLPAYMIYSVMDYYRADISPDTVIAQLTLPDAADGDREREQRAAWPNIGPPSSIDPKRIKRIDEMIAEYYRSGEAERWFYERIPGFNEAQCKVIRQFLEYMRDAHSADLSQETETALERYWHQFPLP